MMKMSRNAIGRNERGAAAIEFALVAPVMILLLIGGMFLSIMGFTLSSLHASAETAARCASLQSPNCTTTAEVQNYASANFLQVTGRTAVFTMTTPACGYKVVGSATFAFNTGLARVNVPLTTQACFPAQTTTT